VGIFGLHLEGGRRPEWFIYRRRAVSREGTLPPSTLKDFGENQHGHVTTAPVGDLDELEKRLHHRFSEGRVPVVGLEAVGPSRKIGVPAMGQDKIAATGLHPPVIMRFPLQVGFTSLDVEFRVLLYSGMISRGVVGDEVNHELEALDVETLFQTQKFRVLAEIPVKSVAYNGKGGASDIGLGEVG
jgi:hypothetical protein